MSVSKLWEPLVDLLFQETSTFVSPEMVEMGILKAGAIHLQVLHTHRLNQSFTKLVGTQLRSPERMLY